MEPLKTYEMWVMALITVALAAAVAMFAHQ